MLKNCFKMISLLIVLQELAIYAAAEPNSLSRSAYFETRQNKRLPGHVVKRFTSPSTLSCSQSCLRNSWCTSTNFKESSKPSDKGICELNKHDSGVANGDNKFVDEPGVTFSMLFKGCLMTGCRNGGSCLFENKKESFSCSCEPPWSGDRCEIVYKNCAEIKKSGKGISGVYTIDPDGSGAFNVFCDQTTAGGGWTVFQTRLDGSVDFYRGWDDYKRGFGNLNSEFWLGLDNIHRLTKQQSKLRVDLEDFNGTTAYAEYSFFGVDNEESNYTLSLIRDYSGTAGDSLYTSHDMAFSTKDRDNDDWYVANCAEAFMGGWWYEHCGLSNLNGLYLKGAHASFGDGVMWKTWKGYKYSVKRAEMKIKLVKA